MDGSSGAPRQDWVKAFDVVVVSAGYGSLVAATILARNGLNVAIVEKTDRVGGRVGCSEWNGYWLDFGHRDDDDYEDNWQMVTKGAQFYRQAAEAAGVSVPVVPVLPASMIHEVDSDRTVVFSPDDPAAPLDFAATMAGATPEQIGRLKEKLGGLAGEDPDKWLHVDFHSWLTSEFPDPADQSLHRTMLWTAGILFALPPEKFSVGRYIELMQDPIVITKIHDKEVGGMQGLPESFAREFRRLGGQIFFRQLVDEILVEDGRVRGVIARDEASVVTEFRAPVVIYGNPIWRIFEVLSEGHFAPEMVKHAHELKLAYEGDSICLNLGLSRAPTIRSTGQPDTYGGYHGFAEDYMGANGWILNSATSSKTAPPGKHLLWAGWFTPAAGSYWEGPFKTFDDGRRKLDVIHDKMREYYADLDEITEWTNYQWHKGYWGSAANFWTIRRSPTAVDTVQGLHFVGSTVEVQGVWQEISAHSGLQAAQKILAATNKRGG